jgi:hypothetical protein
MTQKGIARRLKVPIFKIRKWTKRTLKQKPHRGLSKRRPARFEKVSLRAIGLIREYL